MMLCLQISFLILLCVAVGFLAGIALSWEFEIRGLKDMWDKFIGLFGRNKTRTDITIPPSMTAGTTFKPNITSTKPAAYYS